MTVTVAFKHELSDKFLTRIKQKMIQKWTGSKYFHVEIIIGDTWIEADNSVGVVQHNLRPLSNKYDYVEVRVPDCEICMTNVNNFINNQMGAKYDWTGIYLSQILRLGVNKEDSWFCSELVSKILQIYNIEPFLYIAPESLSPGDLFKILVKKCDSRIL
jgi:uncharacterized protein YycO